MAMKKCNTLTHIVFPYGFCKKRRIHLIKYTIMTKLKNNSHLVCCCIALALCHQYLASMYTATYLLRRLAVLSLLYHFWLSFLEHHFFHSWTTECVMYGKYGGMF